MVASAFLPLMSRTVRLGRKRPAAPPQVLRLRNYLTAAPSVPPPAAVDYGAKAAPALGRMYLNDQLGCCVIAGEQHLTGVYTGNESGTPVQAADAEVLTMYHTICGHGDDGCVITDVLDYKRAKGLLAGGQYHRIDGYVAVDVTNRLEVQTALYLFGGLTLGINLPGDWMQSAKPGFLWAETPSASIGGHEIVAVGYDATEVRVCTWGMLGTLTWAALADRRIVEECYAQLSPDWYAKANASPGGIDAKLLADDLAKLRGGEVPPLPDPAPPPVPPPPPAPPLPVPPWVTLLEEFLAWLRSRAG